VGHGKRVLPLTPALRPRPGNGTLLVLPLDQGREHGPSDFFRFLSQPRRPRHRLPVPAHPEGRWPSASARPRNTWPTTLAADPTPCTGTPEDPAAV